jgi:hypothetical protein
MLRFRSFDARVKFPAPFVIPTRSVTTRKSKEIHERLFEKRLSRAGVRGHRNFSRVPTS